MGTKRPHSDLSTMHASRQANLQVQPSSQHTPNKRARNTPHHLPPKPSAHLLRKKIRDTARVLDHASNMPADARIESERALAGYRQDLEAVEEGRRRAKIIRKYHMVRFFGTWFFTLASCSPLRFLCFLESPWGKGKGFGGEDTSPLI